MTMIDDNYTDDILMFMIMVLMMIIIMINVYRKEKDHLDYFYSDSFSKTLPHKEKVNLRDK